MSRRQQTVLPKAGEWVLIGRPDISLPSDWLLAEVVYADEEAVFTRHRTAAFNLNQYDLVEPREVLAIGDYDTLRERRSALCREIKLLADRVKECARAEDDARKAVWRKLDELGVMRRLGAAGNSSAETAVFDEGNDARRLVAAPEAIAERQKP